MRVWSALINHDRASIETYIRDLSDAFADIQVDRFERTDRPWVMLLQADLRLCSPRRPQRSRARASDAVAAYSGWLREPGGPRRFSALRGEMPSFDPIAGPALGEFSYAALGAKHLALLTDHYATHPIYYCGPLGPRPRRWVASNDLRLLLLCRAVSMTIDRAACLEHLTQSVMVDENELRDCSTFFSAVRKMPPATILQIDAGGDSTLREPAPSLPSVTACASSSNPVAQQTALRECLNACVMDRIEAGASGLMLSGGVDSNTILGASLSLHAPLPFCATMSFEDADLAMSHDDQLVALLVERCGVPHRVVHADRFLRLPSAADEGGYIDGPDAAANPLAKEACAHAFQEQGVALAMTGEGGDLILGESSYAWLHDAIRKHEGVRAAHDYLTGSLGLACFSPTYLRKMLAALSPRLAGREWLRAANRGHASTPDYFNTDLHSAARRQARSAGRTPTACGRAYLGHRYVEAMLYPRAAYFDTLNIYCTHSHPFLDPRMIAFTLACPPHLHHDYRRLDRANPYATAKMLARNAYRDVLPALASDKRGKTSYALMARRMFRNSAGALLRLTEQRMILSDWGLVDQAKFREHLLAYIVASDDPNAQFGCDYHFMRGVTDLETWLGRFSGPRHAVAARLKFRPLRALAGPRRT
ncbi:asparagine synthase-related protein [Chitinasiproducens palmae]|uniref:asparagine synthase (glutamine-hydrolyzing) n=1 Tax=Chitinasiproducens palmae TaxID=1770053 RepID=A0A1H2PLR0_9BURK|nr:asparagine synthetase B family protein [Chitinasiproducens palmae]SDV47384.1 asparagine synthase (glutamine-hydrolysing) [Chitinasiproducens palmae]